MHRIWYKCYKKKYIRNYCLILVTFRQLRIAFVCIINESIQHRNRFGKVARWNWHQNDMLKKMHLNVQRCTHYIDFTSYYRHVQFFLSIIEFHACCFTKFQNKKRFFSLCSLRLNTNSLIKWAGFFLNRFSLPENQTNCIYFLSSCFGYCMVLLCVLLLFFSMAGVPQLKSNVATNKQTSNGLLSLFHFTFDCKWHSSASKFDKFSQLIL